MGQRIRRYHQLQRLQEPSATGLFPRHEILVASDRAIIATLYAYLATGNEKYLDMHKQISDWTYTHFPDKECGEWFGYLHRDGTPAQMAKGNLFKGPFHIPRMMIKGYTLCKEILDNKKSHL